MKKAILSIVLACVSGISATAQVTGNGYYRVKNVTTNRYMSLSDNTSRGVDISSTTVDAMALLTKKNWEEVSTDPATIFYITKVNNDEYDISAQGASLYQMINYYIRLRYYPTQNVYRAWQSKSGGTVYLSDENDISKDEDWGYVDNNTSATLNWQISAVNTEDNYLGVQPTVTTANGKHYASFYASYPFSVASPNMKVYYISHVDETKGQVVYKELTGVIPASTPVIIECASTDPAQNKLKLETTNVAAIKDNQMTGVYFCVGLRRTAHYNSVEFKPETMRVLGVSADGALTFNDSEANLSKVLIKTGTSPAFKYPTITAIPHNTGYIKVSANCPKELKVVDETTGINNITTDDANKPATIYSISGIKVRENATSVEGLPKGVYIFKNKKYIVK